MDEHPVLYGGNISICPLTSQLTLHIHFVQWNWCGMLKFSENAWNFLWINYGMGSDCCDASYSAVSKCFISHKTDRVTICNNLWKLLRNGFEKNFDSMSIFSSPVIQIHLRFSSLSVVKLKNGLVYTGCPGGNVPDFGRMFLTLKYTDITQNTYIRSWTVTEIMAREVWKYDSCYTLID